MSAKRWYFVIDASEGLPGCADSVTYQSEKYNSFTECYKKYLSFYPAKYWRYLRHVTSECIIFECGEKKTENRVKAGMVYYRTDKIIEDLGIAEEQFDLLIDAIKRNQKDRINYDTLICDNSSLIEFAKEILMNKGEVKNSQQ